MSGRWKQLRAYQLGYSCRVEKSGWNGSVNGGLIFLNLVSSLFFADFGFLLIPSIVNKARTPSTVVDSKNFSALRWMRNPFFGNDPLTVLVHGPSSDVDSYCWRSNRSALHVTRKNRSWLPIPPSTDADRIQSPARQGIQFVRAEDYQVPGMPCRGNLGAADRHSRVCPDDYVQLGCRYRCPGRNAAARCNRSGGSSFGYRGSGRISCPAAKPPARRKPGAESGEHIQILAEANLDRLPTAKRRYVRGCSGFSGFKGSRTRAAPGLQPDHGAEILGGKMERLGYRAVRPISWSPIHPAVVLPHPKYCHPGRERPGTVFLHFIGYVRFNTDLRPRRPGTCLALGGMNAGRAGRCYRFLYRALSPAGAKARLSIFIFTGCCRWRSPAALQPDAEQFAWMVTKLFASQFNVLPLGEAVVGAWPTAPCPRRRRRDF